MVDINKSVGCVVLLENTDFFVSTCSVSGFFATVSFVPHLIGLNTFKVFYRPGLPIKVAVPVFKQALEKPASYS